MALDTKSPPTAGDPRVQLLSPLGSYAAITPVNDALFTAHVLLHTHDLSEIAASDINVAVFITPVPASAEEWAAVGITDALKLAMINLLTAPTPAAWSGALPMRPVSNTVPRRRPTAPLDARTSRSVAFPIDFRGASAGHYLLLAVASSAADPVSVASLPGATLQDLVLGSHHVGMRSCSSGESRYLSVLTAQSASAPSTVGRTRGSVSFV